MTIFRGLRPKEAFKSSTSSSAANSWLDFFCNMRKDSFCDPAKPGAHAAFAPERSGCAECAEEGLARDILGERVSAR